MNLDIRALKFWCVTITLAVLLLTVLVARQEEEITLSPRMENNHFDHSGNFAKDVTFTDKLHGTWLKVEHTTNPDGFNPCYTTILSDFRPVVKQRSDKKWEIVFESRDLATEF